MAVPNDEPTVDLGRLLSEALERRGFALPTGSGVAASELSAVAEDFLKAVREAQTGGASVAGGDADTTH